VLDGFKMRVFVAMRFVVVDRLSKFVRTFFFYSMRHQSHIWFLRFFLISYWPLRHSRNTSLALETFTNLNKDIIMIFFTL
jgi:hypothetical protein